LAFSIWYLSTVIRYKIYAVEGWINWSVA
jgi:hypothetical protein